MSTSNGQPGEILRAGTNFAKYEILQFLGAGAMGQVFKARDPILDRIVALKLLSDPKLSKVEARRVLADEARKAASVDSVYVARVWEYSECDGLPFVAFEFVPGDTLREANADLSPEERVRVGRQLTDGLAAIHAKNLIHRDLKPDNIKLTERREAKILDFGLARLVEPHVLDTSGAIAGTPHYMSPEQISGEPLTVASDLFSLGVVLYELFTRSQPFEGDYLELVLYAILHEQPPLPTECDATLPEWVDRLVMKCLAKSASERFGNTAEVLNVFERGLAGQPASAIVPQFQIPTKTVAVMSLANMSDDPTWDPICSGFTDDLTQEIGRRTELTISEEPQDLSSPNVRQTFERLRCDYLIKGSLQRWEESIKLTLVLHGDGGRRVLFGEKYVGDSGMLFELLSRAAEEVSKVLARLTGGTVVEVDQLASLDVNAYEYYQRGRSYYQTNKEDHLHSAIQLFNKALAMDPHFALAHAGLADVYAFQYMFYYERTGERLEAAYREAHTALQINDRLPDAHRALGRYYQCLGRYSDAEKCFRDAVTFNPKYAVGYRTLGWFYAEQGDLVASREWTTKALRLAPTDLESLLLLSIISMDERRYPLALATLHRATELSPDYGRAYYNLGLVYLKQGALERASENFRLAMKYDGDPNAHVDAGYVSVLRKDPASARRYFEEAIRLRHLGFVANYYLAFLDVQEGEGDRAQVYLEEASRELELLLTADPENADLKAYDALIDAAMGKSERAVANLEALANLEHLRGEIYHNVARGFAILDERTRVAAVLAQALSAPDGPTEAEIKLDPHFAQMSAMLGKMYTTE